MTKCILWHNLPEDIVKIIMEYYYQAQVDYWSDISPYIRLPSPETIGGRDGGGVLRAALKKNHAHKRKIHMGINSVHIPAMENWREHPKFQSNYIRYLNNEYGLRLEQGGSTRAERTSQGFFSLSKIKRNKELHQKKYNQSVIDELKRKNSPMRFRDHLSDGPKSRRYCSFCGKSGHNKNNKKFH